MMILPYKGKSPQISRDCFVADNVALVGDVVVGESSSLWFGVSIRAEDGPVRIGRVVNVQDNAVIHIDSGGECNIGDGVSIGHAAVIHGATVGPNSLIGMGSVLLNDCVVGSDCVVGASSLVTQGSIIPDGSLVLGVPASVKRKLDPQEIAKIRANAQRYDELRSEYLAQTRLKS
jgi:carbonic anhydrase/acetyltransferase-like protein (isoleucine patch superfamily)